jgi:hypothetical protein
MSKNSLLIGQIALELNLLNRDQLQQCLDLQAGQVEPRPIGTLLVKSGVLTVAQLARVIDEQRRRFSESAPYAPAKRDDVSFGKLVVQGGYAKQEHVNEALRAQQDMADRGIRKRLGEMLVEAGHLTSEAVVAILKTQGKVLMACTFCGSHFNVLAHLAEDYPCRQCGMPLAEKAASLSAYDTAYLLPAVDPRPRTTVRILCTAQEPAAVQVEIPSAALAPSPDRVWASARVRRLALLLTILGALVVVLVLLTKSPA